MPGVKILVLYTTPHGALTHAAPVSRAVVVHYRPVVDHVLSDTTEAAAFINRSVLIARNVVEYDRAVWIPSKHLPDQFKQWCRASGKVSHIRHITSSNLMI